MNINDGGGGGGGGTFVFLVIISIVLYRGVTSRLSYRKMVDFEDHSESKTLFAFF